MAAPVSSSRQSAAAAGWGCIKTGSFQRLLPRGDVPFSWVNPVPLWRSRNDKLARLLGDPVNDLRREWIEQLGGSQQNFTVESYADRDKVSAIILGDTGEGDGSQYAVVPGLLRESAGSDFMFIISDIIYPAGGIDEYENKFYRPYKDYPQPIYAIPGNHDWYDDLTGFMFHFCGLRRAARGLPGSPGWKSALRRLLWRRAPKGHEKAIARMRQMRAQPSQQARQPGPYFALAAGPIVLVGIDTGITGGIDRDQGEWLRRISNSPRPKILLTGKPLRVNGQLHPGEIEGGGTVDEIVQAPENNYIAAIGGDVHNYQRYPARLEDGRTIQYIVSGGGGAFMNETHKIPNIDRSGLNGVSEAEFRCYPLRGDSLSIFSRNYGRLFALGTIGKWLGLQRLLLPLLFIPPDEAAALMAERLGLTPVRSTAASAPISSRARRVAAWLLPLPGQVHGLLQPFYTELLDWNDAPMFKNFLRLDANADEIVITCYIASGCLEQEQAPPIEDAIRANRGGAGSWTWEVLPTSFSAATGLGVVQPRGERR
ncbi:MAG: metallophosphoesterase family protein [Gaiellaceae bacterium]